MASRSDLRQQYLMQNQLDTQQLVGGGIAAVRQVAAKRQRRLRLWKLSAASCGLLGALLFLQGWRLAAHYQLNRANQGQVYHGFHQVSDVKIAFCTYGGITAAFLGFSIGALLLIQHWKKSRLISRAQRGIRLS